MSAWITIRGLFALALAFTLAEIFLTEDDAPSDIEDSTNVAASLSDAQSDALVAIFSVAAPFSAAVAFAFAEAFFTTNEPTKD